MTLPAKFIGGFAGVVVDTAGYASFFLYAGLLGVPAILLVSHLLRQPGGKLTYQD
jgi:PAT family beta-lactamase induction signal transducer AmpG